MFMIIEIDAECQCWMIIMSLKEQGNQFFRVGRYADAIRCYEEYIEFDPQADKKVAYCNISFCHYKLKDYKDSVESADDSISEDPTYNKAYYRKMQAFKEIPGSEYDVYINTVLLLRFSPNMPETEKYDYQVQLRDYKEKWMQKLQKDRLSISKDTCIFDDIEQKIEVETMPSSAKTVEEWITEWLQHPSSSQDQWQQILQLTKEDKQYGLNLAFLYLNNLPADQPEQSAIKEKIKTLQEALESKMEIQDQGEVDNLIPQPDPVPPTYKKSESSDSNLFESSDHSDTPKEQKPLNHVLQAATSKPTINTINQPMQTELSNQQVLQEAKAEVQQTQTKDQIEKTQSLDPPPLETLPKEAQSKRQLGVLSSNQKGLDNCDEEIEVIFDKYTAKLELSRDLIIDLLKIVELILGESYSLQTKHRLLAMVKQKYPKPVHLMKKSFSKRQQQKVYQLLIQNSLQVFLGDFASRYVSK